MSIFSEVLGAEQAAVNQPYEIQKYLMAQAAARQQMQQSAEEAQRAAQLHPLQVQQVQQQLQENAQLQPLKLQQMQQQMQQSALETQAKQRQQQLDEQTRRQSAEGAGAFADYFKGVGTAQPSTAGGVGGPNVSTIPMSAKPQMQPMTIDSVAQSIYKNNPKISPEGFIKALERFEPILDQQSKMQLEQLKLAAERKPESAAGKIGYDKMMGFIAPGDSGKLKITDLPDAQSRKAALDYQKSVNTIPDLKDQFAKARELNAQSFDSGLIPGDWKALAARGASSLAPIFGMTPKEARDAMVATTKYEQLIKTTIIPRLRAAFGGRVTNFETQFMNDIEGKTKMSKAERDALISQSLEFIDQSDAEARDGLESLGVQVDEPAARKGSSSATQNTPTDDPLGLFK